MHQSSVNRFLKALTLIVLVCATSGRSMAGTEDHETSIQLATQVSADWLSLIDDEKYHESWEDASEFFQKQVPKDRWRQVMRTVRESLGELQNRKMVRARFREGLPGHPPGEYIVIFYATSFESKQDAIETVTLTKESDGSWRVCGYYVK
jgi:ribosomal protein L35AE/L33A